MNMQSSKYNANRLGNLIQMSEGSCQVVWVQWWTILRKELRTGFEKTESPFLIEQLNRYMIVGKSQLLLNFSVTPHML